MRTSRPNNPSAPGITLVEVMLVLVLGSILAVLSINMITNQPTSSWNRLVDDYFHNLSAIYEVTVYSYGSGPLRASEVCDKSPCRNTAIYPHGIADILRDETTIRYEEGPPARVIYPGGIVIYPLPDQSGLTNGGNYIPPDSGRSDDLLKGTHDYEWILMDMNGDKEPNTMGPEGDRLLIHINDTNGRILTAWQKCLELQCDKPYERSFYDVKKGY